VTTPVIVEIKVKPDLVDEMELLLKKILPDTKAFDGFISIDVCHNLDSIGSFVFYEQWKSRRHYEKYLAWRIETGVIDQMTAMSVEPPTISYFELIK
jgi:quinol monooxygenase YgiN